MSGPGSLLSTGQPGRPAILGERIRHPVTGHFPGNMPPRPSPRAAVKYSPSPAPLSIVADGGSLSCPAVAVAAGQHDQGTCAPYCPAVDRRRRGSLSCPAVAVAASQHDQATPASTSWRRVHRAAPLVCKFGPRRHDRGLGRVLGALGRIAPAIACCGLPCPASAIDASH